MDRYLIIHAPRSGSHALMYALADNGLGSKDYEIMHRFCFPGQKWPSTPSALVSDLRRQIALTQNDRGCVLKFQAPMYNIACNEAWVPDDAHERARFLLEVFSPNWTFIYLHRRDVDSAAVSTAFSQVSNRWRPSEKGRPITIDDYPPMLIEEYRSWYERCIREMDRLYEFAPGYKVAYEDLVHDPTFLEEAFGLDLSRIRNKTDHMPDPVKEQWLEKYRLLRA